MAKKKAAKKKAVKKTTKKKAPLRSPARGASRSLKKQPTKKPAAAKPAAAEPKSPQTKAPKGKPPSGRVTAPKTKKTAKPVPKARQTEQRPGPKKAGAAARKVSQGKPSAPKVAGKPAKKPAKATTPSSSRSRAKPVSEAQRSVGESETPNEVGAANVDGGQQRAPEDLDEDLDDAPGQTTLRDESNEEGYGRSEGPAARRLGQTGEYAADDDELQYGRNLTGRNRIPGAGSKRNQ